jgi:hypothetical protein
VEARGRRDLDRDAVVFFAVLFLRELCRPLELSSAVVLAESSSVPASA